MAGRDLQQARARADDQDAEALAARVLGDAGLAEAAAVPIGRVIELIAAAAAFGRRYAVARLLGLRTCRVCGCTEEDGCPDARQLLACTWVDEDLCSACAEETLKLTDAGVAAILHAPESSAS